MIVMEQKVYNALLWIKNILVKEDIPYQVVGGLAARAYGATRAINDIDMYIPFERAEDLLVHVKDFISKPFKHYEEELWDVHYFQLKYKDQKIEIGLSPGAKYFDSKNNEWVEQNIVFSSSHPRKIFDIDILVMPRQELIDYKLRLGREVDLIDAAQMEAAVK